MKKIILALLFIVSSIQITRAQVTFDPLVRGGANTSTITNADADIRIESYLGAGCAINLSEIYALQPEFTVSRQGVKNLKYSTINYKYAYDYYVETYFNESFVGTYVSLALINKLKLFKGAVNLQFGPSIDFLTTPIANSNGDFDLAIVLGASARVYKNLFVETRIKKGAIYPYDYPSYSGNLDVLVPFMGPRTYFVTQLGLVYEFTFDKKNKE